MSTAQPILGERAVPEASSESSSYESILRHPYIAALGSPVRRPGVSPLYLVMLAVVAAMMLVLPAIYLALIGLVGYCVYWHAVNDAAIFGTVHNGRAALFLYLAPLVAGAVLVAFMIKPLFAPRNVQYAPQALNRRDEPLLFAFVDRLCETIGAPKPSKIHIDMDMNASASFAGMFSGLLGGPGRLAADRRPFSLRVYRCACP